MKREYHTNFQLAGLVDNETYSNIFYLPLLIIIMVRDTIKPSCTLQRLKENTLCYPYPNLPLIIELIGISSKV